MNKPLLTLAVLAVSATGAFAQKTEKNTSASIALKAGVNFANVTISDEGTIDDAKKLTSFQVGLQADLPISPFFAIQPGLYFTGKGSKTSMGSTSNPTYYRATSNPLYVELPVNAVFKIPVGETAKVFVGAGPYAAMGVAGKNKSEGKIFGVAFNSTKDISFSDDDPTTSGEEGAGIGVMRRFDYGMNGIAGIEAGHALFSVQYGWGLANIASGSDNSGNNNKHRVLSLSLGYKF